MPDSRGVFDVFQPRAGVGKARGQGSLVRNGAATRGQLGGRGIGIAKVGVGSREDGADEEDEQQFFQ